MTDFPDNASTGGDILVVDDLPDNLKLLGEILKSNGHRFRPMTSGPMALRSVAKQPPELILLDVRMPEMDGFEVCRQLKADEHSRDIPVIFISAKGDVLDKVKAFELGGVDYISKPFEAEEVLARVDTHLALSRLRLQLEERVAERTLDLRESFASLKASEEKYHNLFNTMAQGVVYQDESGKINSANNAAQEILGLSLDQMQGRTSLDPRWKTIHENGEDFPGETHPGMEALRTGKVISNVVMGVYHPEEQQHRWIIVNATPQFREGEDKPYQVYATFTDITDRIKAEEREASLGRILDGSLNEIYIFDADTLRFLQVNRGAAENLGYSVEELQKLTPVDLKPELTHTSFTKLLVPLRNGTKEKIQFNAVHRRKDGSLYPVEVHLQLSTFESTPAFVAVIVDIAERERADAELRESKNYNRMLFEQSPIGLALCRINGELVDINPAYARIIGRSIEDTLRLTYWDITPEKYAEDEQRQMEILKTTGHYGSYEKEYIHKDGHLVPVHLQGLLLEKDGEQMIWSSVEDITERKQAEENIRNIAAGVSAQIGESFFQSLMTHLSKLFGVKYTFIGLLDEQRPNMIDTVVLCIDGEIVDNLSYELADTPCEHVVKGDCGSIQVYPRDLQRLFPKDLMLVEMGGQSYVGAPLADSSGKPIGLIVVLDNKPMDDTDQVGNILRIFATRAAGEIERLQSEQALHDSEQTFRQLTENINEVFWLGSPDWNEIHYVSPAYENKWGQSAQTLYENSRVWMDAVHPDDREQVIADIPEDPNSIGDCVDFREYRIRRPDGEILWVKARAYPIRDDGGKVIRIAGIAEDITKRKKMENALQENEHNLIRAQEIAKIGNWKLNHESGEIEGSEELLKIFGLGNEDLTLDNFASVVHPDDREYDLKHIQNGIEHGVPWDIEHRLLLKDGSIKWVHAIGEPQLDEAGKTISIVGIVQDITERKHAEDVLRESEAGLAEAQRMAHIGSWELDVITNKLEWSDEIYRIFEMDPHKFGASYEAFLEAIHPNDQGRVNAAYAESVKNKTPYSIEHRLRMPDGAIKYVQERCETFYDNEGNPIRSVGTVQDITEQYLAEQSLKKLNRSLRALSACNEVLVRAEDELELLDKVCRIIVDISQYRLAWVGFAEHDEAKTVRPVAQAGYDDGYLNTVKLTWADTERGRGPGGTAIRTGKPCVISDVHSDSRFVPWRQQAIEHGYDSVVGLPLIDGKKPFGVLLVYASEVNSFDEEELHLLQELADDLAFGIVTLRSHQERHQLNRQLQQAQKMESIGQLTGGIAHDFNNILASVLGFTSLALQRFVSDDQPELRDYLSEVLHAGERARDLVSQMLAFSRTGSNNVHQLQLAPMVKEVTKMLKATLASSIQLSSQIDADVPAVMMNPVQLQQVLMNICINARDAIGDKGRIDIRVRRVHIVRRDSQTDASSAVLRDICDACHHDIGEGDYAELSVQDSGSGISDDTLQRIFEPFFTTKDVNKGTGMGLSMVHGIIHQHEGHILVDTEIGIGTTFRLLFPVGKPVPNHRPDIELKTNRITEGLNGARILIVDDEESIGRFMGDLFENRGGKPTIMVDSQAALDLFSQDPTAFDLVITDQTMPGLMGAELAQEMLALRPDLPVILCTGYSEQVDEAKAKALGIRGYLTKPMDVKTLFNLVQSLIV